MSYTSWSDLSTAVVKGGGVCLMTEQISDAMIVVGLSVWLISEKNGKNIFEGTALKRNGNV